MNETTLGRRPGEENYATTIGVIIILILLLMTVAMIFICFFCQLICKLRGHTGLFSSEGPFFDSGTNQNKHQLQENPPQPPTELQDNMDELPLANLTGMAAACNHYLKSVPIQTKDNTEQVLKEENEKKDTEKTPGSNSNNNQTVCLNMDVPSEATASDFSQQNNQNQTPIPVSSNTANSNCDTTHNHCPQTIQIQNQISAPTMPIYVSNAVSMHPSQPEADFGAVNQTSSEMTRITPLLGPNLSFLEASFHCIDDPVRLIDVSRNTCEAGRVITPNRRFVPPWNTRQVLISNRPQNYTQITNPHIPSNTALLNSIARLNYLIPNSSIARDCSQLPHASTQHFGQMFTSVQSQNYSQLSNAEVLRDPNEQPNNEITHYTQELNDSMIKKKRQVLYSSTPRKNKEVSNPIVPENRSQMPDSLIAQNINYKRLPTILENSPTTPNYIRNTLKMLKLKLRTQQLQIPSSLPDLATSTNFAPDPASKQHHLGDPSRLLYYRNCNVGMQDLQGSNPELGAEKKEAFSKEFSSDKSLLSHLTSLEHFKCEMGAEKKEAYSKEFSSDKSLLSHLTSLKHVELSDSESDSDSFVSEEEEE